MFLCGHVGNLGAIDQVACDAIREWGIECAHIDWWRFIYDINKDFMESKFPVGHAAEVGTSILKYLFPHLVVEDKMILNEKEDKEEIPDLYVYEYFDQETPTSVLGDPFAGSYEKGEKMIANALAVISKFIKEW